MSKTLCADQPGADICGNLLLECKPILSSTQTLPKDSQGRRDLSDSSPLCSFLKLVFIFQLQVLDQNKAETQE